MELLSNPKTEFLLDASLESLHTQSVAWMNELIFWSDEMTFFYQMLHHKKLSAAFPSSQVATIDKELVRLNGEKLDKVKTGVASHERLLASVYKSSSLADEQVYREAHRKLLVDMQALNQDIRTFKKKFFAFVENEV
ncbi:MAG TPA: hypothetical protein VFU05_05945 [Cyclobacteriaceae bacterium]|nr:hypothetical protein [Cyclobacteriaceae bacterium]